VSDPTHDEVAELLGAYALNAVDPAERVLVEAHLEHCPRCRGELRDHAGVASLLGNSGADAPPGVWDRIAATLEEAPPPMRLQLGGSAARDGRVVPIAAARSHRGRRVWVASAAAAAVAVIALLGAEVVRQDDRIGTLQSALSDEGLVRAANVALDDPDAVTAELSSTDGALHATAVLLPDGTGYLLAEDMPGLDRDRTYQLWGQTTAGLVSLGLLGAAPGEVVAFHAGAPISALAVTDEEAPGVGQSVNPPVVAGRFD
jgi:hypothetical protein